MSQAVVLLPYVMTWAVVFVICASLYMDFLGRVTLCSPGMIEYYTCNITVQCPHRVMLLVCSGKTDLKTDSLISRSSEYYILLSSLSYKCFK